MRIIYFGFLCVIFCLPLAEVFAGTVEGQVMVQVLQKAKRPARYHLGSYRSTRHKAGPQEGGPQDVVIYLEGAKGQPKLSTQPPAVMRQKDEVFVPRVLPIQAGTIVEFPNEDNFYHNVFSVMAGDRFDLGRYAKGETARQVFAKPGVVVVRCEIHAGMKAFIVVLETAYFTVPDTSGVFKLPDVPVGQYQLKAWHPTLGEQTRSISIAGSDTIRADFSF